MRELILDALKGHGADYAEIRLESAESTRLQYRGRELEETSRTTSKGGMRPRPGQGRLGLRFLQRPQGLEGEGRPGGASGEAGGQ